MSRSTPSYSERVRPSGVQHPDEIARLLWEQVGGERCIAWVGSGLSTPSKYPGWVETIRRLCQRCGVPAPDSSDSEGLIDKAEDCKQQNSRVYVETLAELFGEYKDVTNPVYMSLIKLPFKAFITTNFDPLLADAARIIKEAEVFSYPNLRSSMIENCPGAVFYVHGCARLGEEPMGNNLVLSRTEFEQAYNGFTRIFLEYILTNKYPIVFFGCKLEEPATQRAFRLIKKLFDQSQSTASSEPLRLMKAVVPTRWIKERKGNDPPIDRRDTIAEQQEDERLGTLGIKVVRYFGKDDVPHQDLDSVLRALLLIASGRKPPQLETPDDEGY